MTCSDRGWCNNGRNGGVKGGCGGDDKFRGVGGGGGGCGGMATTIIVLLVISCEWKEWRWQWWWQR